MKRLIVVLCAALFGGTAARPQIVLNSYPSRTVGHPVTPLPEQNSVYSLNANLVEGRELYSPQGIAVDTTMTPPALYVSDTGNNRVLGWRDATSFVNGQKADIVIGQDDFFTTWAAGPGNTPRAPGSGTAKQSGLYFPSGLTARNQDLYVVDTGNNRVLRFPKPFTNLDHIPDLVIGQPNLSSTARNYTGDVSAKGIYLSSASSVLAGALAFDRDGNLWITDPGNRRVLQFAAADIATTGAAGLEAVRVIGQADFATLRPNLGANATGNAVTDQFAVPRSIAFDSSNRLYVADADPNQPQNLSRVLVFEPPFLTAMSASRMAGVIVASQNPTQLQRFATLMSEPRGIFFTPTSGVGIVDSRHSRILVLPQYEQWSSSSLFSPTALTVFGHDSDFMNLSPNNMQAGAGFIPKPSDAVLFQPAAAAVAGDELFVADTANNRVLVMKMSGTIIENANRVLGQDRMDTGSINLVESRGFQFASQTGSGTAVDAGLAIDGTGESPHLYVADTYNNRVLGYRDIRKVSAGAAADLVIGQEDGQTALCNYPSGNPGAPTNSNLCGPVGLLVDSKGDLWVADRGNGRVLRFRKPFEQQGQITADLVLGQQSFTGVKITDATASTLAAPYGLAMTVDGMLLASDQVQNRVLVFQPVNGVFANGQAAVKVIGQSRFNSSATGTDAASLNSPHHIALDVEGRLYVTDSANNRVLIYDKLGNAQFPASGAPAALTLSGFNVPLGIYVNPTTGEFWVADSGNGQYKRYPAFLTLVTAPASTATVYAPTNALAVMEDRFGALVTADASSRVAFHYPGLATRNLANSLSRPLAPGAIASAYPYNAGLKFGDADANYAGQLPLPAEMADIQVLFDGIAAPLYMVAPDQINFYVPMNARTSGFADLQVLKKSTGQVYAAGLVAMNPVSPGVFLSPSSQTGKYRQAAVINYENKSPNSADNKAQRGSWIEIYGTGQGFVPGAPADGDAPGGPLNTTFRPLVFLGACSVDDAACTKEPDIDHIYYSGLAPGLVGVWQINVKIPMNTAPGTQIDLAVIVNSMPSYDPTIYRTTIAVQ